MYPTYTLLNEPSEVRSVDLISVPTQTFEGPRFVTF